MATNNNKGVQYEATASDRNGFDSVRILDQNTRERRALPPRLDLRNYGADCYSWGCDGPGSDQLALAMLADAMQDDVRAPALQPLFKREVIAVLPQNHWVLDRGLVQTITRLLAANLFSQELAQALDTDVLRKGAR